MSKNEENAINWKLVKEVSNNQENHLSYRERWVRLKKSIEVMKERLENLKERSRFSCLADSIRDRDNACNRFGKKKKGLERGDQG